LLEETRVSDLFVKSGIWFECSSAAARVRAVTSRSARLRQVLGIAFLVCLAVAGSGKADSQDSMQGLDEQVQEVKTDVLAIATELKQLEEKLLYPSDTQVAVFVSLADGDGLDLDSLRIQIDGEPVAHHIYEFKEMEALHKGGVQRIYTGNLATGEHRLDVSIAGTLRGGSDFNETESFSFYKEVEPKVIDLTLDGKTVGGIEIELGGG
jgi:hypothetical protein